MAASITYRKYNPLRGWVNKPDLIAVAAQAFAEKLGDVTCVRSHSDPDDSDARQVNDAIRMIAERADQIISALIADAELQGLEPTGDWISVGGVEQRSFEVPTFDAKAARYDEARSERRIAS